MSSTRLPAALLTTLLLIVACSSEGPAPATSTATQAPAATATRAPATPTPTATPESAVPSGLYELNTETGIDAADAFLALLAARQFDTIALEAVFLPIPCTESGTGIPTTPVCRDQEPAGQPVTALLHASCEPSFIQPEQRDVIAESLSLLYQVGEPHLDSVWRVEPWQGSFNQHLGPSYAVVLVVGAGEQTAAFVIYLDDEGHYGGRTTCGDYREPAGEITRLFPA